MQQKAGSTGLFFAIFLVCQKTEELSALTNKNIAFVCAQGNGI
jgi:hypothetical protein